MIRGHQFSTRVLACLYLLLARLGPLTNLHLTSQSQLTNLYKLTTLRQLIGLYHLTSLNHLINLYQLTNQSQLTNLSPLTNLYKLNSLSQLTNLYKLTTLRQLISLHHLTNLYQLTCSTDVGQVVNLRPIVNRPLPFPNKLPTHPLIPNSDQTAPALDHSRPALRQPSEQSPYPKPGRGLNSLPHIEALP